MDFTNSSYRLGLALAVLVVFVAGAVLYLSKEEQGRGVAAEQEDAKSIKQMTQPTMEEQQKKTEEKKEIDGAVFQTSLGEVEVAFFRAEAPQTVENFVRLAGSGFYDSTKFHRVIKDFMIQGGDPLSKDDAQMSRWGTGGPGYQFADEFNKERLVRGVLAMANSGPNTNGSQFFIVTAQATPWLDGRHTVFGKVVKGMDVVDKIEKVEVGERDIPKTAVVIEQLLLK
jgi:cyclophilin family peptidyl-prolyl cis-trans isomerase